MSQSDKVVSLPSAQSILDRLYGVYPSGEMRERFYPLIAQEAGRELVAQGVAIMFTTKIDEFVKSGYPPVMADMLHQFVPRFIEALVDDQDVALEARGIHQAAMRAMGMKQ